MLFVFILITTIVLGIVIGYLTRRKNFRFLGSLIMGLICILLFIIGVEIGADKDILRNIHLLGFNAVVISVFCSLGSMLFAWFLWRLIKSHDKRKGQKK